MLGDTYSLKYVYMTRHRMYFLYVCNKILEDCLCAVQVSGGHLFYITHLVRYKKIISQIFFIVSGLTKSIILVMNEK